MQFHKVRWLCLYAIILLICFLFLFLDVKKQVVRIFQKKVEERNLLVNVENNKNRVINAIQKVQGSVLQIDNTLLETSSALAYLANFFEEKNVTVNNIQLLKVKTISGVNVLPVKVSAAGQFSTFLKLIVALSKGSRPMVINDFLFQRDSHGAVVAEMRLLMFGVHVKAFTMNDRDHQLVSMEMLENTVSLEKMKWGGFLQDGEMSRGFLILPDGKTVEVQVGAIVGVERGRVIDVKENEISVNVTGKIIKIT